MSFNMKVDFNEDKNIWVFTPEGGDLDIYTSDEFKEESSKSL